MLVWILVNILIGKECDQTKRKKTKEVGVLHRSGLDDNEDRRERKAQIKKLRSKKKDGKKKDWKKKDWKKEGKKERKKEKKTERKKERKKGKQKEKTEN